MPRTDLRRIGRELAGIEKFLASHAAETETLGGFIERVSPHFHEPKHLAPFVEVLEQAERAALGQADPVFACCSVPSQHGKTETVKHALAKIISKHPEIFCAYLSYSADRAEDQSRSIRDYATAAGTELRSDTTSVALWRTPKGGGLAARGVHGGVTGLGGLTIAVLDDPFSGSMAADSRLIRDRIWTAFQTSIWTRLRKRTSIVIIHTRWHEDDLIGRIKRDDELSKYFRFINLPAIKPNGEALWPEEMPLELLRVKRAGTTERDWWSIYMGEPRPRTGRVFEGVTLYDAPPNAMRMSIGTDLAYSAKTSSDWNVAVVLGEANGFYYIVHVERRQCQSPEWEGVLKALRVRYRGAPIRFYYAGPERGIADYMRRNGVPIDARPATADKLVRARPASDAWNTGKILVPHADDGSPIAKFTGVVQDFTGMGDLHDDDVDALAAAYDQLATGITKAAEHMPPPSRERPYSSGSVRERPYGAKRVRPYG
jgi:phage terminase large subunit-like protein